MAPAERRDVDLEAKIDAAYSSMVAGKTEAERTEWFTEMARLIRCRSNHQVMKMELQRRLNR